MKSSVVITTYNGEKYIEDLLVSLINQTRKIDEVLIYDDCSSDRTVKILNDFINSNDLNWKITVNEKNVGWQENFKNGILEATNEVIFPCDQDDIWELDKVETMMNFFETNSNVSLLTTDYNCLIDNRIIYEKCPKIKTNKETFLVNSDKRYLWILRPGCVMAFSKKCQDYFSKIWNSGYPHDALVWSICTITGEHYHISYSSIKYRRHNENATLHYMHKRIVTIKSIERHIAINNWLIEQNIENKCVLKVKKFLNYRLKLYKNKSILAAFKLLLKFNYYTSLKKCIADIVHGFFMK